MAQANLPEVAIEENQGQATYVCFTTQKAETNTRDKQDKDNSSEYGYAIKKSSYSRYVKRNQKSTKFRSIPIISA